MSGITGYYISIEAMKDVIVFDIQQYRIPTSVSADFFTLLPIVPRQDKKCCASGRKSYFLCIGRTAISGTAHGIHSGKLYYGVAPGAECKTEGQG